MGEIIIREVTEADAAELLSIYAPYVEKTAVTYEYVVPSLEEFRERIRNTGKRYPYFAAVEDGKILGYAYASPFHPRAAFAWAADSDGGKGQRHRQAALYSPGGSPQKTKRGECECLYS